MQIINNNFLFHSTFLQSQTNKMQVHKREGITRSDSGLNCDTFNIIYITDHNKLSAASLQEAIDHFKQKNFTFCIWINEENLSPKVSDILSRYALHKAGTEPGMLLNLEEFNHASSYADIRRLTTEATLQDFAHIVSLNWNPPDMDVIRFYDRVAQHALNLQTGIAYYACYIDDKPVSVIEIFPDNKSNAGIYSVCTLAEYRGRGIATNLMKYCLRQLKLAKYKTATLQAADDGLNIYKNLGFVESTRFYEFKPTSNL